MNTESLNHSSLNTQSLNSSLLEEKYLELQTILDLNNLSINNDKNKGKNTDEKGNGNKANTIYEEDISNCKTKNDTNKQLPQQFPHLINNYTNNISQHLVYNQNPNMYVYPIMTPLVYVPQYYQTNIPSNYNNYLLTQDKDKKNEEINFYLNSSLDSIVKKLKSIDYKIDFVSKMNLIQIKYLFYKLIPSFKDLLVDINGNYFCQLLFTQIDKEERIKLWKIIKNDLIYFSCHQYSTHCIQKLIELSSCSSDEEQKLISKVFNKKFLELIEDSKGNHVAQKLILHIKYQNKQQLVNQLFSNMDYLICDNKGVCLVKQYVLSLVEESREYRSELYSLIENNIFKYILHKSGHYFILHLIDNWKVKELYQLFKLIEKNFMYFSIKLYSSRVVEKCISHIDNVGIFKLCIYLL